MTLFILHKFPLLFFLMPISSFVSPQQWLSTAGWGLLHSVNVITDTPPAQAHPYVSRFTSNDTFAKEKGRVQGGWKLVKKLHFVVNIFNQKKRGFFFKPDQSSSNHCTENHLPDQPDQWLVTFSHERILPLVQNNICKTFTFGKQEEEITLGIFILFHSYSWDTWICGTKKGHFQPR